MQYTRNNQTKNSLAHLHNRKRRLHPETTTTTTTPAPAPAKSAAATAAGPSEVRASVRRRHQPSPYCRYNRRPAAAIPALVLVFIALQAIAFGRVAASGAAATVGRLWG